MPPLVPPPDHPLPRLITYYQTHHDASTGAHISLLPLITAQQPRIGITHIVLAAIHLNDDPFIPITLNDHPPDHARFTTLWAELRVLQASGIKILGMLGGAAKGTYARLDLPSTSTSTSSSGAQASAASAAAVFEANYAPLRQLIRDRNLDGLDLDVEEEMSLAGIVHLIDRLRADFGPHFIITLAPVAMALLDPEKNLSGFDYQALEVMRGRDIAWYNTQFYCGWGNLSNTLMYDMMLQTGWPPHKLVVGVVTNPANGSGFVPWEQLAETLAVMLRTHRSNFGGVMGWEYFNSLPGDAARPWEWASRLSALLRPQPLAAPKPTQPPQEQEIDPDSADGPPLQIPDEFEYYSDGCGRD